MAGFALHKNKVFNWSGAEYRIDRIQANGDILLERMNDGQLSIVSREQLLTEYAEGKISAKKVDATFANSLVPSFSRPLDELSEAVRNAVKRRKHYLESILDHGVPVFTPEYLKPLIERAATEIGDAKPPAVITLYRWYRRFKSMNDARAIIPRTDLCGPRETRQSDLILQLVAESLEEAFKPYPDNGHLETATTSGYDQYTIYDVYQFLARIEYLRRDLRHRHSYDLRCRWPFNIKPSVQSDSERWSLRFLTADRKTRTTHLHRLLRWNFRQHKTVLVRGSSQSPLTLVLNALVHLQKNPFANAYFSQANALLLEYQVGIESLVGVYFHPRLPISYHQQYLTVLARWWHGLANRLVILEPEYQFEKTYRLSTGGGSLDQVIDVLNTLFDAALSHRPFECYGKFAKRWSIPEAMRRRFQASEILAVMVAYLSGLQSPEISFFHCLLEDATYVSAF